MQCLVSADDIGLTRGITDGILEAHDRGYLNSTSVVANGSDFGRAVAAWKERPELQLTVHLNLMEGAPVSPPDQVGLLLDEHGEFGLSFPALLAKSLSASGAARRDLFEQIYLEVCAQVEQVAAVAGPNWKPRLDGHQHYHMIPLVFEAVMKAHDRYQFSYIRALSEPFFRAFSVPGAASGYLGPNLIKHGLLKALALPARRQLTERGIPHCRWFVGLLFSGHMHLDSIQAALDHLERRGNTDEIVEVLLHPGRAASADEQRWQHRSELRDYYRNSERDEERATLCDPRFREVVRRFPAPVGQEQP